MMSKEQSQCLTAASALSHYITLHQSNGTDDETRLIARRYVVRRHFFNLKLRFVHHSNVTL